MKIINMTHYKLKNIKNNRIEEAILNHIKINLDKIFKLPQPQQDEEVKKIIQILHHARLAYVIKFKDRMWHETP